MLTELLDKSSNRGQTVIGVGTPTPEQAAIIAEAQALIAECPISQAAKAEAKKARERAHAAAHPESGRTLPTKALTYSPRYSAGRARRPAKRAA